MSRIPDDTADDPQQTIAELQRELTQRTVERDEALAQQTATNEILQVINSSPDDLAPVFDKIVDRAVRLCDASGGALWLVEGDLARATGGRGGNMPEQFFEYVANEFVPIRYLLGRDPQKRPLVHNFDLKATKPYRDGVPFFVANVDLGGARTCLSVALIDDRVIVGVFTLVRQEVRPFTDKQIAVMQTFAAQAVTAIQNARLFDEVQERTRELAASLDELRAAQDRLIQTEKLASLGQLTAGIAHEIKNPLNFVNNFAAISKELASELAEALEKSSLDEYFRSGVHETIQILNRNLEKILEHGNRADSIVKNMLLHSREGSGDHRPTSINLLVEETLNLAYHGARAEKPDFNVKLEKMLDSEAGEADIYPQEITRVLLNLISNGFYASAKRKREGYDANFLPTLVLSTRNLGQSVEIRIRDNGTGIPGNIKSKMFNPFFTTKPPGEGTGLGLSISHDIVVKQHGGRIEVVTEPGSYTEFTIILPRSGHSSFPQE